MPFDPNKFINPGQFSDYSSYSGMGGDNQQMKSLKQVAAEAVGVPAAGGPTPDQVSAPVAPPQTIGEMATQQFNQAVAPVQQKFTNVSNAATQFGQGNFAQGVNAYRGYAPATPQPQPSVINQHYGVE
jgi:hypothetical protein